MSSSFNIPDGEITNATQKQFFQYVVDKLDDIWRVLNGNGNEGILKKIERHEKFINGYSASNKTITTLIAVVASIIGSLVAVASFLKIINLI